MKASIPSGHNSLIKFHQPQPARGRAVGSPTRKFSGKAVRRTTGFVDEVKVDRQADGAHAAGKQAVEHLLRVRVALVNVGNQQVKTEPDDPLNGVAPEVNAALDDLVKPQITPQARSG